MRDPVVNIVLGVDSPFSSTIVQPKGTSLVGAYGDARPATMDTGSSAQIGGTPQNGGVPFWFPLRTNQTNCPSNKWILCMQGFWGYSCLVHFRHLDHNACELAVVVGMFSMGPGVSLFALAMSQAVSSVQQFWSDC